MNPSPFHSLPLLLLAVLAASCKSALRYQPRDGDILFQTSRSAQSTAIQQATHSRYSHLGVMFVELQGPVVLEAVQPVRLTPLEEWIRRGEGGHFVVRRLREADRLLTGDALRRLREAGRHFEGKDYDAAFAWSDGKIYCSELVWKMFQRGIGVEPGKLQRLDQFDFSNPLVKAAAAKRWNGKIPGGEPVISPAAVFADQELVTVFEN